MRRMRLTVFSVACAAALGCLAAGDERIELGGWYDPHVQGVCTDGTNIYWSMTRELVKTDLQGKVLALYEQDEKMHIGDLCWHDGKVYAGINAHARGGAKTVDAVWVFDPERLTRVKIHPTPQTVWCNNGLEWHAGRFWIISCCPTYSAYNYVFEYTEDFRFVQCRPIASGWTNLGVQTICKYGDRMLFGCYGTGAKAEHAHKSCTFSVALEDLTRKSRNEEFPYIVPIGDRIEFGTAEGLLVLDGRIWVCSSRMRLKAGAKKETATNRDYDWSAVLRPATALQKSLNP